MSNGIELRGHRFDGQVVAHEDVAPGGWYVPMVDGETTLLYGVTEDRRYADYVESYPTSLLPDNPLRALLEGDAED